MDNSLSSKIANFFLPRGGQARFLEVNFFQEQYKPIDPNGRRIIQQNESKLNYPIYGGIALGFALGLSLRRYIPSFRSAVGITKILPQFFLVMLTGGFATWNIAVPSYLAALKDFREELVLKNDPQYLNFLKRKFISYQDVYKKEMRVFQEFMNEDKFLQWYSDHPQYVFEMGQEPAATDFTSKDKWLQAANKAGSTIPLNKEKSN